MWFKCEDKLPNKDGTYLTVEKFGGHNIYRIAGFRRNLGTIGYMQEYDGQCGFYDSDPEWGSFVVKLLAWKYIERYKG